MERTQDGPAITGPFSCAKKETGIRRAKLKAEEARAESEVEPVLRDGCDTRLARLETWAGLPYPLPPLPAFRARCASRDGVTPYDRLVGIVLAAWCREP
jgi:hypothetical protein